MALHVGDACPPLKGAMGWIGEATDVHLLKGRPFIVVFWSISCPACLASFATVQNWLCKYHEQGLNIVLVHSPRISSDFNASLVEFTLQSRGVAIPCALDSGHRISESFQTQGIWPYYFLFDGAGKLKSRAASEVGFKLLNNALDRLMANRFA